MRKSLVFGILLALLSFPAVLWGQGMPGYAPPMAPIIGNQAPVFGSPWVGGVQGPGDIWVGNIRVSPSVRAGYERVSLNFTVPIADSFQPRPPGDRMQYNFHRVDMTFDGVDSAVGSIGLLAESLSGWAAFVQASGNLAGKFSAELKFRGNAGRPFGPPWEWRDSDVDKCWGETGISYRIYPGLGLICGIRFDRIDAVMRDPRNSEGRIPEEVLTNALAPTLVVAVHQDNTHADMKVKLYTPFIGIGGGGYNYRWHVIGSLFGWGRADMPIRLITTYDLTDPAGSGTPFFIETINSDSRYTLKMSGGQFIRGDVEYRFAVADNLTLGGWLSAAAYGWNGTGRMGTDTYSLRGEPGLETVGPGSLYWGLSGEEEAGDSKFRTSTLAGGAMLTLIY